MPYLGSQSRLYLHFPSLIHRAITASVSLPTNKANYAFLRRSPTDKSIAGVTG